MHNNTQLERYKKLRAFIDENFKEDINIERVEEVSFYSYRNINRIFEAIHLETIGAYVKRLRLNKAAQYLLYSELGVMDIAFEVGFEDRAAFSKAFKKKYGRSPAAFRSDNVAHFESEQQHILDLEGPDREKLTYDVVHLPDFEFIFLEYRGAEDDFSAMEAIISQLYQYVSDKNILTSNTQLISEIIDYSDASEDIRLQYNQGCILERPLDFKPEGLFRIKKHRRQKYARFIHEGSYESYLEFYRKIYAFWMWDVALELVDRPNVELHPNDVHIGPSDIQRTEIYIPIV